MNKVLKRLGIAAGVLIGLVMLAALIVPLFVHVDDYRPQIVKAVNDKINGKLELGRLSLSLWGQVKVNVGGFALTDAEGRKLVSAKDVYFHLPLWSLLTGSPVLTFKMENPEVNVIKNKDGKLNVLTLMKPSPTGAPAAALSPTPSSGKGGGALPGIASRARLGIELRDALVQYRDEVTKLTTDVRDLNVQVKDMSLSHPTQVEVWANLDTRMGKTITVKGPARLTADAQPVFSGSNFESASGSFKADLDGLEIVMPGLFEKRKGVDANASGKFAYHGNEAALIDLALRFFNAEILGSGSLGNIGAATGPTLKVAMKSNEIALHPWNELVPMLKSYDLGGTASLEADAGGTISAPQYHAELAVKQLTAKAPMLKAQPRIDAHLKVVTDRVDEMKLTMTAPGNDLNVSGKVVNFAKPKIDAQIVSRQMDLDQLIDMPKKPAAGGKAETTEKTAATGKQGPASDFDAMLDPLRENEMLASATASLGFRFAMLKAQGMKITDLNGQASFRNLVMALDSFKMKVFGGAIDATMAAQLKPRAPSYRFHMGVNGLDLKEAVTAQMNQFKNTVLGKASFKMDGTGASFNPEPAKRNLNAKGNLTITDASFGTFDIGRMVTEALTKTIQDIGNKVPPLKNQHLNPPGPIDTKYQQIAASFTIAGDQFVMPDFVAKSVHGIDLKGDTRVGLLDNSLKASWEVSDPYNVTGARNLSVNQNGVNIEHVLAAGNDPVKFPIVVGGTIFSPQPNYGAVAETLGKVALGNLQVALQNKAKAEAQRAAADQLKKLGAPPALQNLSKSLFGH